MISRKKHRIAENGRLHVRRALVAVGIASAILLGIFCLQGSPETVERLYSSRFYPWLRSNVLVVFDRFPFPLGDLVYLSIAGLFFYWLVKSVSSLSGGILGASMYLLRAVILLECVMIVFYSFWAINYYRQPASVRLGLNNYSYTVSEFVQVTAMLVDSTNAARQRLRRADLKIPDSQVNQMATKAMQGGRVKRSLFSAGISYLGTSGYFNPLTGEAQYNGRMPDFIKPFVACHEIAHQFGYGAEDEANFAAFLGGKDSDDDRLRYSSYYLATQEFLLILRRADSLQFRILKEKLSPQVLSDMQSEKTFWLNYQGRISRVTSVFYDLFLRANRQPEGLKTYNRMVLLTMAYFKKRKEI